MAKKRAPANDLGLAPWRAMGDTSCLWVGRKPVSAPFPDIARNIVETKAVGWKAADGRGAVEAVLHGIKFWEVALPDIGPRESARLPMDSGPGRARRGPRPPIRPRWVNEHRPRRSKPARHATKHGGLDDPPCPRYGCLALRPPPARTFDCQPPRRFRGPLTDFANGACRDESMEDERPVNEFSIGYEAIVLNEGRKLCICHRRRGDLKGGERHTANRALDVARVPIRSRHLPRDSCPPGPASNRDRHQPCAVKRSVRFAAQASGEAGNMS